MSSLEPHSTPPIPISAETTPLVDLEVGAAAAISEATPLINSEVEEAAAVAAPNNDRMWRKEAWAWWSYNFAAESYACVGLTVMIPVALEQIARSHGFLDSARTMPCVSSAPSNSTTGGGGDALRCRASVWGIAEVDSASFSLYSFSAAVAVQALIVISLGSIADHPPHRKALLLTFAFTGSFTTLLFFLLPTSTAALWPLSSLVSVIGIACFGCSFVCSNAYLPDLSRCSPIVLDAREKLLEAKRSRVDSLDFNRRSELERASLEERPSLGRISLEEQPSLMLPGIEAAEVESDDAPLLGDLNLSQASRDYHISRLEVEYEKTLAAATSRISSMGVALGYSGGVLVLIPAFIVIAALDGSMLSLKIGLLLAGLVWAVFTLPAARWLGTRKEASMRKLDRKWGGWPSEIVTAWVSLAKMLTPSEIKRLRNTFWFLLAWAFLSDASSTISSTAIIFGKTALSMTSAEVTVVAFLAQATGILGGIASPILQKKYNLSNMKALLIIVVLMSLIPAYGLVGMLPFFKKATWGGLRASWEMYMMAVFLGFLYGPFQSFARSTFSTLIPPGQEAKFYGLYSITDKSSSFMGPFIVGFLVDVTKEIRWAFAFLFIMLLAPLPILIWKVDMDNGREDALRYTVVAEREEDEE